MNLKIPSTLKDVPERLKGRTERSKINLIWRGGDPFYRKCIFWGLGIEPDVVGHSEVVVTES